jgi:FtsH-binding integral membrane protein
VDAERVRTATAAAVAAAAPAAAQPAPRTVEQKAERIVAVLLSIALAMFSWGSYGVVLHRGQAAMQGSRLRPLLCIGAAYFLIAVLVPLALLVPLADAGSWSTPGILWSLGAGTLGALGALGTILAFTLGGKPFTVMPVVFGCAPVINTLTTLALHETPLSSVNAFFLAGMLIVAVGAATVLAFGPRGHAPAKPA